MSSWTFANPTLLFLGIIIVPIIVWYLFKNKKQTSSFRFSDTLLLQKLGVTWRVRFRHFPFILRILLILLLVIIIARPQSTNRWSNETTEGIDIVMALDISSSMLAEDFKPNRLGASKDVAVEFIGARPNDRIGLVVFSGESFTQCPITHDHKILINLFREVKSGMLEDGTAIGLGLSTAVARIKDSKAESKVIILLTDGVNNKGAISPATAAEIALTYGIRVYTIGVGTNGTAPYPFQTAFGVQYQQVPVEIDEEVLRNIAHITGGKYFRATNNQKLKDIYQEIDKMEKTIIDVKKFNEKNEEFMLIAWIALAVFLLEIALRLIIFRKNP